MLHVFHPLLFLCYVPQLLHVENTMAKPWDLAGPPGFILHQSMIIIILVNGALGFCGYWRYGDLCMGSISLNLPKDNMLVHLYNYLSILN